MPTQPASKPWQADSVVGGLARALHELPPALRRHCLESLRGAGDLRAVHAAFTLSDEALSAVMCGDRALLEHKIGGLILQGLAMPVLLELSSHRIRCLSDSELFRMHVASSAWRSRLAETLAAFVRRYSFG